MEKLNFPSENILKQAIAEIEEPLLFKKMLQDEAGAYTWKLLDWKLSELIEKFGNSKLPFRIGCNSRSKRPQWEVDCLETSMTLSEFVKSVELNGDDFEEWSYFDYKYMNEWFKDKPEILESIQWKRFGFEKTGNDSTLWIGSKGAHTNCHQDSYGCNLIAQIQGRKQWLLFPPSSTSGLQVTRIPYEESTVYSKFNFFAPTEEDERNILKIEDKPKLVTLEPGDVLFVPAGWWHYVESLELSISVNIWLPIATDNISRVKEALVKLIVARVGKNIWRNSDKVHGSLSGCMKLLDVALGECKNTEYVEPTCKITNHTKWTANEFAMQYPHCVKLLQELEKSELEDLLRMKRERFPEGNIESVIISTSESEAECESEVGFVSDPTDALTHKLAEDIVNAFCHPDVINKVTNLLLSS
ncbi:HSPB1 associated protein 1 [Halictus rubicundus]|uniref:HSPB1 associated protein 1 n=1 Tax=Halictus rubicundus TaxID=77578 RepID=UPI004035472B